MLYSIQKPTVRANTIYDNGNHGIYLMNSFSAMIQNNIIYGHNISGIYLHESFEVSTIVNNTLVNNNSYGIRSYPQGNAPPVISNCIVWNHVDDLNYCNAIYSCIKNETDSGQGIIHDYPGFIDEVNHNFRISDNSPCRNNSNPDLNYDGQFDIDNQPRVQGGRVDIGADEIWHICDFDYSERVNLAGFSIMASQWLMQSEDLSSDIAPPSGDDKVDMMDLKVFVQHWLN